MKSVNVKEIDQLLIYHISIKTMDIVCRNSSPKNKFVDSFASHIITQNKTVEVVKIMFIRYGVWYLTSL